MPKHVDWYNAAGDRWCSGCEAFMAPDLFGRGGRAPDGLQRDCKLCRTVVRREQYRQHRERNITYSRQWAQAHPEQARKNRRSAQRTFRLRKAIASGAFAQRMVRQEHERQDMTRLRQWIAREGVEATSVADAQRMLGCSYRRARRLYLASGGVIGVPGAHPLKQRIEREERAG